MQRKPTPPPVPKTFTRRRDGATILYRRHEELGSGGFGSVFRITDQDGEAYALKAIWKGHVSKSKKSLDKVKSEIAIQRSLHHKNILKLYDSFDDTNYFYIILELCQGHSVRDNLRKARRFDEAETRRILRQVMDGLCYLHDNRIIHRDLKPDNFLVASDGTIKIADFGLSAKLDYDDERKYTMCGTPNYLCPELVARTNKGHSYEVDIWAIGVCAFAMLTGHPPFESNRKNLTYEYIRNCQYRFPSDIPLSHEARDFIKSILQIRPERRPNAQDLMVHPFITGEKEEPVKVAYALPDRGLCAKPAVEKKAPEPLKEIRAHREENVMAPVAKGEELGMIAAPKYCVARFCDHSDKYGLGYMLADGTVGACFNDLTRMVMDPFETFVQYWDNYQTTVPEIMDPKTGPQQKKLSLLRRFSDSLKKTKSMFELPEHRFNQSVPMRHVKYWMRNDQATLFRMDDRNIQVNFNDRTKLIIFWNTKQMMMVHNIKEIGQVIAISDVTNQSPMSEERKRFAVAKAMLAEMSGNPR